MPSYEFPFNQEPNSPQPTNDNKKRIIVPGDKDWKKPEDIIEEDNPSLKGLKKALDNLRKQQREQQNKDIKSNSRVNPQETPQRTRSNNILTPEQLKEKANSKRLPLEKKDYQEKKEKKGPAIVSPAAIAKDQRINSFLAEHLTKKGFNLDGQTLQALEEKQGHSGLSVFAKEPLEVVQELPESLAEREEQRKAELFTQGQEKKIEEWAQRGVSLESFRLPNHPLFKKSFSSLLKFIQEKTKIKNFFTWETYQRYKESLKEGEFKKLDDFSFSLTVEQGRKANQLLRDFYQTFEPYLLVNAKAKSLFWELYFYFNKYGILENTKETNKEQEEESPKQNLEKFLDPEAFPFLKDNLARAEKGSFSYYYLISLLKSYFLREEGEITTGQEKPEKTKENLEAKEIFLLLIQKEDCQNDLFFLLQKKYPLTWQKVQESSLYQKKQAELKKITNYSIDELLRSPEFYGKRMQGFAASLPDSPSNFGLELEFLKTGMQGKFRQPLEKDLNNKLVTNPLFKEDYDLHDDLNVTEIATGPGGLPYSEATRQGLALLASQLEEHPCFIAFGTEHLNLDNPERAIRKEDLFFAFRKDNKRRLETNYLADPCVLQKRMLNFQTIANQFEILASLYRLPKEAAEPFLEEKFSQGFEKTKEMLEPLNLKKLELEFLLQQIEEKQDLNLEQKSVLKARLLTTFQTETLPLTYFPLLAWEKALEKISNEEFLSLLNSPVWCSFFKSSEFLNLKKEKIIIDLTNKISQVPYFRIEDYPLLKEFIKGTLFDDESLSEKERYVFKRELDNVRIINLRTDLIKKMQPYDISQIPEFKKIIMDKKKSWDIRLSLIEKMQSYDPNKFPEFKKIIKNNKENFNLRQALAKKADSESTDKLPMRDKVYFWYSGNELKEKLDQEYPHGWDPAVQGKQEKEMVELIINADNDIIRQALIEKMQPYDATKFSGFREIIADEDELEYSTIRQALIEKMQSYDPNKFPEFKEVVKNNKEELDLRYDLAEKAIPGFIDKLSIKDKVYFWELLGELETKLNDEYPHGWDPAVQGKQEKEMIELIINTDDDVIRYALIEKMQPYDPNKVPKFKKIVKDNSKNYRLSYNLANKADPKFIDKLSIKDKVYFWELLGELETKLNDEYPHGWDPAVQGKQEKEMIELIINTDDDVIRYALIEKMQPYDPNKVPKFKKIIINNKENYELSRNLIEKADPKSIDKLPMKDKVYFWNFKKELKEKLNKEYPHGWDPAAQGKQEKAMIDLIINTDNRVIRRALINKMQPYDPKEFPGFKKFIKNNKKNFNLRQALANKADPKSIDKLPIEDKVYFWYFKNELKEKLNKEYPHGWDPTKEKEVREIVEGGGNICGILARQANPQAIESLSIKDKVYFWYFKNELKEKLNKEYPHGWDPTVKGGKEEEMVHVIINTDNDVMCQILIEKMKPYDPTQVPKFVEIIADEHEKNKVRLALIKKIESYDSAQFPEFVDIITSVFEIPAIRHALIEKMQSYNSNGPA